MTTGLKISLTSPYSGTCANGYLKITSLHIEILNSIGRLEITTWQTKNDCQANRRSIGTLGIPIGDAEILDTDGVVLQLAYEHAFEKSFNQIYDLIKTKKIRLNGEILDLTTAIEA